MMVPHKRSACCYLKLAVLVFFVCSNFGCTSINSLDKTSFIPDPVGQVEIQRGRPHRIVDGVGKFVGIPNRLAILDQRVDNHQVSAETENAVANYLTQNSMSSVLIRVNQYDPVGEWRRLVQNKRIRPGWKFTVGSYQLLKYTLIPGRIFGGDWYNPFTDSINLYSDVPALAVSRAAYAHDVRNRLNPGAYATLKEIPFAGLQHDTVATQTTLSYFEQHVPDQFEAAENVLLPSYGADWGGQIASIVPYGQVIGRIVGGSVANVANRAKRRQATGSSGPLR